ILLFFMLLGYSGWTVRTLCIRLYSLLQGKQASGRPWWYRHRTELPREWHGPE
ncbi:TPA: conjugal transfer protein, partial [Escherichia coli]|nr:conjugal transfer protein [Escherichia coli]